MGERFHMIHVLCKGWPLWKGHMLRPLGVGNVVHVVWVVPRNASFFVTCFREVGIPNLHVSHYYWEKGTTSNIVITPKCFSFWFCWPWISINNASSYLVHIYLKLHVFTVDLCHMISLLPLLRWQKTTSMHPNQPTIAVSDQEFFAISKLGLGLAVGETIDAMLLQATHWATHNTPMDPKKKVYFMYLVGFCCIYLHMKYWCMDSQPY